MTAKNAGFGLPSLSVSGLAVAALVASLLTFVGTGVTPADAASGGGGADFNGDGFDDLVIGAPGDNVSGKANGGSVNVIYGSAGGVSTNGARLDQVLSQNSTGVGEVVEANDEFGAALAIADFNSDGYEDLAIGVPGESVSGKNSAGAVNVIYGSPTGLKASGGNRRDQLWTQDTAGIDGGSQTNGRFGVALTVGDFNDDDRDDLAIGATGATVSGLANAGAVHIIYATADGLSASVKPDQVWSQNVPRVSGVAETNGMFGASLAAGDLNNDSADDLIVGAPNMTVSGQARAGAVNVIYGSAAEGLSVSAARNDQYFTQDTSRVGGVAQVDDQFGASVASGDLNNDGFFELIVGVASEQVGTSADAGAVHILYGSDQGASAARTRSDQLFSQNSRRVQEIAEASDRFGSSVSTGDFNGDNYDDLIVGASSENLGAANGAGGVHVIYGSRSGASSTAERRDQFWEQDVGGINDANEAGDNLGWSVGAGDFNNDGHDDLIAGAPGESIAGRAQAGSVHVIYGHPTGLSATATRPDQAWNRAVARVEGAPGTNDNFGRAIAG